MIDVKMFQSKMFKRILGIEHMSEKGDRYK